MGVSDRMWRRMVRWVAVVTAMVVLSGCVFARPVYSDRDGGRAYLLGALRQKYGLEFQMVSEIYKEENLAPFSGRVAPVGRPEQVASAGVTRSGRLSDSWGVYPFAERMVAQPSQVCAVFVAQLVSCRVRPRVPYSDKYWDPAMSLEEFLAQSNAANDIFVEFRDTSNRRAMAPVIVDMMTQFELGPQYVLSVAHPSGGVPLFNTATIDGVPTVAEVEDRLLHGPK